MPRIAHRPGYSATDLAYRAGRHAEYAALRAQDAARTGRQPEYMIVSARAAAQHAHAAARLSHAADPLSSYPTQMPARRTPNTIGA